MSKEDMLYYSLYFSVQLKFPKIKDLGKNKPLVILMQPPKLYSRFME